jgi:hypothetical protein
MTKEVLYISGVAFWKAAQTDHVLRDIYVQICFHTQSILYAAANVYGYPAFTK